MNKTREMFYNIICIGKKYGYIFLNRQDKIELNELTLLGMDRISAYISLLFLTVDSDYDLVQDEFYSDLYVVKRPQIQKTESEEDNIFDAVNNAENIISEETNGTVKV
jgi:chromatin segregation and condensation protein Rec8/ScpA/Scc1 (kleisin family)